MEKELAGLKEAVVNGKAGTAVELVEKLLGGDMKASEIIDGALIPAMDDVGKKFQSHEFFIPELLVAARAMEGCMKLLEPLLIEQKVESKGVAVVGTVKGDLHDIGKNIVAAMLKGAGFKIVDLGPDVAPEKFAGAAKENNADIIAVSALLTTTMKNMRDVISALDSAGLRGKVKVMVGGAPLTQKFADEIGADGYGEDAADAVRIAKQLVG